MNRLQAGHEFGERLTVLPTPHLGDDIAHELVAAVRDQ
jgi:hypothetical protein